MATAVASQQGFIAGSPGCPCTAARFDGKVQQQIIGDRSPVLATQSAERRTAFPTDGRVVEKSQNAQTFIVGQWQHQRLSRLSRHQDGGETLSFADAACIEKGLASTTRHYWIAP